MQSAGSVIPYSRFLRSPCSTMCYTPQPFTSLRAAVGSRRVYASFASPARLRLSRRASAPAAVSALALPSTAAFTTAAAAAAPQHILQLLASSSSSSSSSGAFAASLQEVQVQLSLAYLPQAQLALGDVSEGLETPVQLVYLLTLLGFLVVGAYLVVRQVLIRRELEEAAKVLGDRVRAGEGSSEDYFELGVILLRKKLYTQATTNLEKAKKRWEGEPEELAQVHNALGYSYFNMEKLGDAVEEYRRAVTLQPGYVTAWNNLADAYEQQKKYQEAYDCYKEALTYDPANKVAAQRSSELKLKLDRMSLRR